MTAPEARTVIAALVAGGRPARFVGGCVRDAVIGRPVKDTDIATPEPPDRVMALLAAADIRAVPTGLDHGTVTAVTAGAHFEITTLRRDVETFGRRARVAFTDDWVADAARRDFTINALFCDPDGTLYDPTGGLADLAAGRIRFVGAAAERIREDVLRLLRFFRFHAHYGRPPPDEAALAACRAMAGEIHTLSAERVWSELRRILVAPAPAAIFALMRDNGVLQHLMPEARRLDHLAALAKIGTALGRPADPLLRLAAALDADAAGAEAIARRLRMSNAEAGRLDVLFASGGGIAPALDPRGRRRLLYRIGAGVFVDRALFGWAEAVSAGIAGPDDAGWRGLVDAAVWVPPGLPVGGRDVMALGVARGPEVGRLLARVESWWIEGDFAADRAACLEFLRNAVKAGLTP